jgi:hypothetical protein
VRLFQSQPHKLDVVKRCPLQCVEKAADQEAMLRNSTKFSDLVLCVNERRLILQYLAELSFQRTDLGFESVHVPFGNHCLNQKRAAPGEHDEDETDAAKDEAFDGIAPSQVFQVLRLGK